MKKNKLSGGHLIGIIGLFLAVIAIAIALLERYSPISPSSAFELPPASLAEDSMYPNISYEEYEITTYPYEQRDSSDYLEDDLIPEGTRLVPVGDNITLMRGTAHICPETFLTFSPIRISSSEVYARITEYNGASSTLHMSSGYVFPYSFNGQEFRLTILAMNFVTGSCTIIIHEVITIDEYGLE